MFQSGHLSAAEVGEAIRQAATLRGLEIVHFVGGDPLLHPDILADGISAATRSGLKTGITTSAYWAKTPQAATATVDRLRQAGLTELTISYDDAHAEFLPVRFIANAVQAALAAELRLRVAVVVEPGCRITAASLRTQLGLDGDARVKVYQTAINSTGRAASEAAEGRERARLGEVYRGPCESILRNFMIDHEGGIRPCCGVLPHHDGLRVGHIHDLGLSAAVDAAYADPLYKWISLIGPVEILAEITADDPEPMLAQAFDGICTACDRIFSSPDLLARVRSFAERHRDRIDEEDAIFNLLATLAPSGQKGLA
jgi:MoaA/NifB/PqqE/SkfB family radical SAM enzyme